jgi:hypothetical protein
MLSSPSIDSGGSLTLVFRGQSRTISLDRFSAYSSDRDPPPRIEIDPSVSPDVFDQFAAACQGGSVTITRETGADLGRLFSKWRMPDLSQAIDRWIAAHADDMLLPTALAEGVDCSAALAALSANLPRFLDDPLLLKLPLRTLSRVLNVRGRRGDVRRIFAFLLGALDRIGPAASVLFVGLDFAALAAADVLELLDRPSFIWEFVAEAVAGAWTAAKAAMTANDETVDRAIAALPA